MTVDAVIFDMDGTLLDSRKTVPTAYADTIRELCGRRYSDDEIIAAYSLGPASTLISHFIGRPATDSDLDCWLRHFRARLTLTVVYPGIRATLTRLADAGVQLGVFTGATRQAAELQLEQARLRTFFGAVVGSDEVDHVKPAPDGIHRACDLLGVSPATSVYVGDATDDLRCAHAAGAVPLAARWGHLYEPPDEPALGVDTPEQLTEHLIDAGCTGQRRCAERQNPSP